MKNPKRALLGLLFLTTLIFQIYLVTRWPLFYPVLKVLSALVLALAVYALVRLPRRDLVFTLIAILAVVAVRIPFYAHADGLVFTSDNALEALQPMEIRDSRTTPLYLLDSASHNGTFKYLIVAFVWDVLGKGHLTFVLVQLLFFLGLLRLIYESLKDTVDRRILAVFLTTGFIFIEVVFDYSLFLRAGPYLEAVFFAVLGIAVLGGDFRRAGRVFLSGYFLLFAVYLHPVAAFFAVPFALTALIKAAPLRRLPLTAGLLAAGAAAGAFAMLVFMAFDPPSQDTGEWFRIVLLNPATIAFGDIPVLAGRLVGDFWTIFKGLFETEILYDLRFFELPSTFGRLFYGINRVLIGLSLAVLLGGLALSLRCVLTRGKPRPWSRIFFLLLTGTILGKIFLLSPRPLTEPRHNWDLAFLVILAYLFVASEFVRIQKPVSLRTAGILALLLALAVPHYTVLLKMTRFKEASYAEILGALCDHRVKVLNTDFIIAYPVYYLSNRTIAVTDDLGPVTIRFFYPWLREEVARVPWKKMAYLFFAEAHYRTDWHREWTDFLFMRLILRLEREKIPHRVVRLDFYTIVIPEPAMGVRRP